MRTSIFTLLAIATAVVTMSSCSQNDGGSSNDLNLSQTTQSTTASQSQSTSSQSQSTASSSASQLQSTADATFKYQASVANDALDIFDITITRTIGGKTTTFLLDKACKIKLRKSLTEYEEFGGKTMDIDSNPAADDAKVTATVTLKSDWKARVEAKGDGKIVLATNVSRGTVTKGDATLRSTAVGNVYQASSLDQQTLENLAARIAKSFSYSK